MRTTKEVCGEHEAMRASQMANKTPTRTANPNSDRKDVNGETPLHRDRGRESIFASSPSPIVVAVAAAVAVAIAVAAAVAIAVAVAVAICIPLAVGLAI